MVKKPAKACCAASDEMKPVKTRRFENRDLLRVVLLRTFKEKDLLPESIYFPR